MIEAIIRKSRFEDVKEALLAADIEWFSYYDVRGVGKSRQGRIYRGIVYDTSSIERILQTFLLANDSLRMANQLFFFCRDRFDHLIVELRAILSNLSQQLRHHPSPDLLPTSNFSSFDSERQPLIVCSRYCIYS